jgi:hypothetical protein
MGLAGPNSLGLRFLNIIICIIKIIIFILIESINMKNSIIYGINIIIFIIINSINIQNIIICVINIVIFIIINIINKKIIYLKKNYINIEKQP